MPDPYQQDMTQLNQTLQNIGTQIADFKSSSAEKQTEFGARLQEIEQKMVNVSARRGANDDSTDSNVVTAQVVAADGIAGFRNGMKSTGQINCKVGVRAAITNPNKGVTGSTSYPTTPQRDGGGIRGIPQPRLSLLDVLPVVPVTSATYEFVRLDGYINGAAYQKEEGEEKAEGSMPTKMERAEIATIATWIPASLQVLQDNDQLEGQINTLMSVGVRQKLEAELINGDGGAGEILGFKKQAIAAGITTGKPADRIGAALTDLKADGWNPNVIVMNPRDWFAIESERAEDGDGQYVIGTPRDPAPPSLWGTPVVVTNGMPQGEALILDTSVAALLDRQEVTVEASRHDGDNFRRNMVTILAELRAGLAVFAPTATRLVTLAGTPTP
ncbi:phage major capsid protein [Pseudomonas hunanensis]|uniref:phage major capsid protein n=1 Tax=Pseudomonas hunanensis TaxID=1247546 RepID=UPI001FCFBF9D|nr:phage major capsid protein [Pseudomonas hunanensis]